MTLYPCVYVLLTLPLSAGRMWSMAHNSTYSNAYACVAGGMITSCGWVDSLLYTLTRRKLLKDTMPGASRSGRTRESDWDNELGSKGITHTRTVTVEGGQVMDTLSPTSLEYGSRPRSYVGQPQGLHSHHGSNLTYERAPSPTGSVDPMLAGRGSPGKNKSEISVQVSTDSQEKQDEITITAPPPGWVRHRSH